MYNHRVSMIRRNLDGIPQHALLPGFSIRWYQAGDRETWVRIQALAERHVATTAQVYDKEFGRNEHELARRQAFLFDADGREIGTATAWFNENYHSQRFGRVHWVAIVPEDQGKGLAKPLLTMVCNRLIEIGHERVYLVTGTARLPAINRYLSYGFEPEILTDEDRRVWNEVFLQLRVCFEIAWWRERPACGLSDRPRNRKRDARATMARRVLRHALKQLRKK